jgi:hypothetical protein
MNVEFASGCFTALFVIKLQSIEGENFQLPVVVMRAVLPGLKQDGEGKFHAAFADYADDPAGLVPGDVFSPVHSRLALAAAQSGTFFPFLSFRPVFLCRFSC